MSEYDVVVIGGGPAGLSAAISAHESGSKVLLIEREECLGGILKQCIHDGFGLTRYGEKLTGPEYAQRDIDTFNAMKIDQKLSSFVTRIEKKDEKYAITLSSRKGVETLISRTIVFATGCRERTARQVFIHGQRPAGIYTAGTAQNLVNLLGLMPTRRCVILGSGDIGLIMARRLTLQGAQVISVLEVKDKPSGLQRNIRQCLEDFNIPLYLSTTVSRVFGTERVEAVETVKVDANLNPIKGTEQIIPCDALIVSVGLIPENELPEKLGITLDSQTKGAAVDNQLHSLSEGIFFAGNCLSVNDLVDYVSENGTIAGKAASDYAHNPKPRQLTPIAASANLLTHVPQYFDRTSNGDLTLYLRSRADHSKSTVSLWLNDEKVFGKKLNHVKAAEAIRLKTSLAAYPMDENSRLEIRMEENQ